jgi:sirohydrochlorin cobaltochelatase
MKTAVILVGHGAPPRGFPRADVQRLKSLEGKRTATGGPMTEEEAELDRKIRSFPRTPENDPYREGLEALAAALRPRLGEKALSTAYNEFCAPTIDEAAARAIAEGAERIEVVPSMLTPGGVHSEVEIPEAIERIRAAHPGVTIRYAWPYDLGAVARLLVDQLERTSG